MLSSKKSLKQQKLIKKPNGNFINKKQMQPINISKLLALRDQNKSKTAIQMF